MSKIEQTTRGSNRDYRRPERDDMDDVDGARASAPQRLISSDPSESSSIVAPTQELRRLRINESLQAERFLTNNITTAKYSILSFLPKFLFEQFRRYANIFFLCIGLLQQIPDVSPTGRFVTIVPFTIILALTALKELVEDIKRHHADDKVNESKAHVLGHDGRWEETKWRDVVVGNVVRVDNETFFPADLVLLASSEPQGMCYIETSNLDGETNLKIRSAVQLTNGLDSPMKMSEFRGDIECETPNRHLYEFKGNIRRDGGHQVPLAPSSILLRGAKLMNTGWIYGVVIYTGHETKLLMNSTQAPLKRSNIDRITNYQIIFLFLILLLISLVSSAANEILKNSDDRHEIYLSDLASNNFFYNFLTFIILYNNLIPISLQVTLEFIKFTQAYFINWDREMFYEPSQTPAMARTSNLNEELGQIKYVFSDKTGTLTRNIMEFKKSSIAGKMYAVTDNETSEKNSELVKDLSDNDETARIIEEFLVLMATCHTVIPENREDGIFYNASSPDEKALVEGAARYGYEFVARKPDSIVLRMPDGDTKEWEVLHVIEFTSSRKRMTVIVRSPKGQVKIFVKGADTMIMERLGDDANNRKFQDTTIEHLEFFAQEGLRTLVLASRDVSDSEYDDWSKIYYKATTNVANKQKEIDKAAELVEKNLFLLGATAIEDKLQDGVPETIAQLLEANIHVWVLTGDKQETAINIGHSCKLLRQNMPVIIINAKTLDETREEILAQLAQFRSQNAVGKDNEVGVVVDGKTLTFALEDSLRKDFLDLCCSCQSVICCRVSPMQKADMVELVQQCTGAISLAIGDGANDVAMIQKADVGVGISGNEGLQAANSSDFAIAQFRYLARLLFVHGAWNYTRISKVILYSFYKNICLYVIELWFAFYNHWSGQVLFERWTIGMYNIFFTSCPPLAMGLFDQYCNAKTRMAYPSLYQATQKSDYFNHRVFWLWIGKSVVHSMILYWLPMWAFRDGIVWENGKAGDYLVVGNIVYTLVVITVNLKAGLEMESWSWITHVTIWGSIIFWVVFLSTYSFLWPLGLPIAANMAGMIILVLWTPLFWFGILLVPFTALLPDIIFKAIRVTIFTSETDRTRIAEIMQKDVSKYVPRSAGGSGLGLTESSALLRNVRKVFRRSASSRATEAARAAQLQVETGNAAGAQGGDQGGALLSQQTNEEIELAHGYAFSQEEGGVVSQAEFVRRYDTTKSPGEKGEGGGGGGGFAYDLKFLRKSLDFPHLPRATWDGDNDTKKSLFGQYPAQFARHGEHGGQSRQVAGLVPPSPVTEEGESVADASTVPPRGAVVRPGSASAVSAKASSPSDGATGGGGSFRQRVKAKHGQLPAPQSPKRVNVKSRANRRTDARTEAEVEPLTKEDAV